MNKESFMPPPKVTSSVIQLKVRPEPPIKVNDEAFFFRFIKACFAQRRKTLLNTVSNTLHIEKDVLRGILAELGIEETVRSEQLSMEELGEIANKLK